VFLAEARVKESAPGLARAIGSDPDPVLAGYSALALRDLLRAFDGDRAVRGAALDGALAFMDRLLAGRKANGFGSVLDIADQLKDPSLVGPLARVAKRASDLHSYEHIVTTIHSIGGKPAQQALRALLQGEKNPDRRAYLQGLLRS
jgi:hypothetical protein